MSETENKRKRPMTGRPGHLMIKTFGTQVNEGILSEDLKNIKENRLKIETTKATTTDNVKFEQQEKITNEIEEEGENKSKKSGGYRNNTNQEKLKFIYDLSKGRHKDSFEELLKEEADRIDNIEKQKEKIKDINLLEKNVKSLYEWQTLFNKSKPMKYYTQIIKEPEKDPNEEKIHQYKIPIVLVDLPLKEMNNFFKRNDFYNNSSNNILNSKKKKQQNDKEPAINDYIIPMSFYEKYNKGDFYFSNTFSDYYNQDFKEYIKKLPVLQAKIKTNPRNLKTEIKKQNKKAIKKEKKLSEDKKLDNLVLSKQDLIIAADLKNPVPLMASIFKKCHPEDDFNILRDHIKKYNNTMKPYGNDYGDVDYTVNDRWRLTREIIRMREEFKKNKQANLKTEKGNEINIIDTNLPNKLVLKYYDNEDPYIKKLNSMIENNTIKEKSFTENYIKEIENSKNSNISKKNEKKAEFSSQITNFDKKFKISSEIDSTYENYKLEPKMEEIYKEIYRPTTGSLTSNNDLHQEIIEEKNVNNLRPKTCKNRRRVNFNLHFKNVLSGKNNLNNELNEIQEEEVIYSNGFPTKKLKPLSSASYNNVNKLLKHKKELKNKNDEFIAKAYKEYAGNTVYSSENSDGGYYQNFKKRPQTCFNRNTYNKNNKPRQIESNINEKWFNNCNTNSLKNNKKLIPTQKVNAYCFNDYVDTVFTSPDNTNYARVIKSKNEEHGYFYPLNIYNKMTNKYYSSSNNAHIKTKRQKRNEILNKYYLNNNDPYEQLYTNEIKLTQTHSDSSRIRINSAFI